MAKNYENQNKVLVMIASLSIILVATGTISTSITQHVAAQSISIPTNTTQQANCDTAGSSSSIAGSCNNNSTNNIANSGGVLDLNTQPRSTITVIKHVINDNGGTAQASDFIIVLSDCSVQGGHKVAVFRGSGSGTTVAVDPSPCYHIQEFDGLGLPLTGYFASFTGDCSTKDFFSGLSNDFPINVGDQKTCTVNNDDVLPTTITVIKHVINDNGGTLQASDFTMRINTCPPQAQILREFPGSESGTTEEIVPGQCFNVGEAFPGPISYDISMTGDCNNVVLFPGDQKTCTVTNNDRR